MNIIDKKHCNQCGVLKQSSEFSKCRRRKDGLQPKCKECNKKDNKKFRTEIQPDYYSYINGYFADKTKWEYISLYNKADKPIKIYMINFDDGSKYIGSTKALMQVRLTRHIADYRRVLEGHRSRAIPLLHNKFDEFDSVEDVVEHIKENTVIIDECVGSRTKQYRLEALWMKRLQKEGVKLLNKQIPRRYQNIKV